MSDIADPSVRIAGYQDFRRIGSGGFSAVYRARQTGLGRDVAVKVLNSGFSSETDRRTFERECHTMGVLSRHPNIVTVYSEAFSDDGRPCIVMELYRENFRERLDRRGPLPVADLLSLGVKTAGALQSVHDAEILHRDLKPHNLFLSDYGEPALGDFGISTVDGERSVTGAGGLSVAYAAPEVLEDSVSSASTDVYSLGATLYHLLDGSAPFSSGNIRTTIRRILTEAPPMPDRADVPKSLCDVLSRSLAKQPDDRFVSAMEFAEALRSVQTLIGLPRTEIPSASERLGDLTVEEGGAAPGPDAPPPRPPPPTADGPGAVTTGIARRTDRPTRGRPPAHPEPTQAAVPGTSPGPRRLEPARDQPLAERTVTRTGTHDSPGAPSSVDEAVGEPSRNRRRTAAALGVGAVTAVAVGVAMSTIGDSGGDETVTTSPSTMLEIDEPDDGFLAILAPPGKVSVSGTEDGSALVRFDTVSGAVGYEATSVAPSRRVGLIARGEGAPLETGVSLDDAACWQVVALGEAGRVSRPAAVVCVDQ